MKRCALVLFLALGARVAAAQVTVDSASARAVLRALSSASLTLPQAGQVCAMPGNQGLVLKEISYGRPATTQICAEALLAAAQGKNPDPAFHFRFEAIKPRVPELSALLDRIEANPVDFQNWVTARVNQFSPKNAQVPIVGYLLAGGNSGGFAFGKPQFYLDLGYFDDYDVARVIMAHELYHAVQGAYADKQTHWWSEKDADKGPDHVLAQQCSTNSDLFDALYEEGTASYVGDPFLLKDAKSAEAGKMLEEMQDGLAKLGNSVTLLELSVVGLNAPDPVPFDQVYAIGFYVPETEYKLGYVMAKALATDRGDAELAALLTQPGYAFAAAYLALPKYGQDKDHPRLGPNTAAAVSRLGSGCVRPAAGHL